MLSRWTSKRVVVIGVMTAFVIPVFSSPAASVGPKPSAIAFDWVGLWRGPVRGDYSNYRMSLTLVRDADGALAGHVRYTRLDCGGTWSPRSEDGDRAVFHEHILRGRERCVVRQRLRARLIAADRMRVHFKGGKEPHATVHRIV